MYGGQYGVTEEQVRFYEENGFVQLHNVLTPAEVASLRRALDVAIEERKRLQENWGPRGDEGYTKVFLQMVNVWERYAAFEYVLSPRIGGIARQLTRADQVRLWHDHALIKYPRDSKATAWHQDKVYWPMKESGALSCWMALDDVTVENGCMWFIPGSHKLGPLNPVDLGNAGDADLLQLLPMGGRESAKPSWQMKAELHVPQRPDLPLRRTEHHAPAPAGNGDHLHACGHPLRSARAYRRGQGSSA
jgi:hypothetical protein